MHKKPLISIITVTFNAVNVLESTILSIIHQTFTDFEYIIVDGNSSDGTQDIIKKYKDKISKILIENDNGLYDAMNKAIRIAEGEYLWFLNAGDQMFDDYTLLNLFKHEPIADIIYSDTLVVTYEGHSVGLLSELTHNNAPQHLRWTDMKRGMVVCHQSFIVKKEIAPEYNLKYKLSSDVDWVITCLKRSKSVELSEKILTKFLNAGLSKQHLRAAMKERYVILQNHFGFAPNLYNHIYMLIRYMTKGRKSKV